MYFIKQILPALFITLLTLPCLGQETAYEDRLSEIQGLWKNTSAALEDASGYPLQAGQIDLNVAGFFIDYIEWELEHPEIMKEALIYDKRFRNEEGAGPEEADRRYQEHLERELSGVRTLLNRAVERLEENRAWPDSPEISWEQMTFDDGYFRIEGEPVFTAGFPLLSYSLVDFSKFPEWEERDKKMLDAFLGEMRQLGVGVEQQSISIPAFLAADGSIRSDKIQNYVETIQNYARQGFKVNIMFHWGENDEVLEDLWPGITDYEANGVELDIDHPGARELILRFTEALMPVLGELDAIATWDMANEPFFSTDMWSPHTLDKYQHWLEESHGSIERLNAIWETGYTSFEKIPLPKEKPRAECSPGEWYDRISFHNHRVTSFFGFFSKQIRKHIPDAKIHMKAQDNSSLGPMPAAVGHGIDREALTPFVQLHGLDTRPLPITEPRMAASNYDESYYGFHWLGQSFLYDYLTSLPPTRPIVDFEYHAFSINPIRIPDLPTTHASATLWLAHLHGMIGNMAWYWHRRYGPDPFLDTWYWKLWFYASLSTQPVPAAEYFQTMLELNSFSQEVEALASVPDRPLRILVSKPSYIQDQAHIDALHRTYEGSSFHGLRVGFVTENMLARDGVPEDCRMILIPDAGYVSKAALEALKNAESEGIRLVRYGERKPNLNSHGFPHAPETVRFLEDNDVIEYTTAPELSSQIGRLLSPMTKELPIRVERIDRPDAFGVMNRQTQVDNRQVVLLVNVLDHSTRIRMVSSQGKPVHGRDLLSGEIVDGTKISMPVQKVRLIQINTDQGQ